MYFDLCEYQVDGCRYSKMDFEVTPPLLRLTTFAIDYC